MRLWGHSSSGVTKIVGQLKHRMFKEKLRGLGLVTMEKEAVGDTTATYCVLGECKEKRATILLGAGRTTQKIKGHKGQFLT